VDEANRLIVSLKDSLCTCAEILDGLHDDFKDSLIEGFRVRSRLFGGGKEIRTLGPIVSRDRVATATPPRTHAVRRPDCEHRFAALKFINGCTKHAQARLREDLPWLLNFVYRVGTCWA
jgi:hypothetical protein